MNEAPIEIRATAAYQGKPVATPPHAEECARFLERVEISSIAGLSDDEVAKRFADAGPNRLPEGKKKSAWLRVGESSN